MILKKIQAECLYNAMMALNAIGGLIHARNILCGSKDCQVHENGKGQIVIATNAEVIEIYENQEAFATAYGLEL